MQTCGREAETSQSSSTWTYKKHSKTKNIKQNFRLLEIFTFARYVFLWLHFPNLPTNIPTRAAAATMKVPTFYLNRNDRQCGWQWQPIWVGGLHKATFSARRRYVLVIVDKTNRCSKISTYFFFESLPNASDFCWHQFCLTIVSRCSSNKKSLYYTGTMNVMLHHLDPYSVDCYGESIAQCGVIRMNYSAPWTPY